MSLLDKWNKNKFSIYKSEEKTVLKLLETIGKWIEEVITTLDNKTDLYGDHKGSWQGLNRPTMSEEGMRATVEKIVDVDLPSIYSSIEEFEKFNENNKTFYTIEEFKKVDDVDDTNAFRIALSKGNVRLKPNGTYRIDEITVPNYRIIDLNMSTIWGNQSTIFKIGENSNSYFRNVIIKNGVLEQTISGSVINMTNCIDCKIENIKIPHILDNSHGIRMVNGFNNIFDTIWVMNGVSRITNGSAINMRTQLSDKVGVSNITNVEIKNCLFQNLQYGIIIDATSFSIDTVKIHNQGISDCGTGIYFASTSTQTKVCDVDVLRVENSDIGVDSNSAITIRNAHFYNTALALNNKSNGRMVLEGVINFAPSVTKGIKNIGYGYFDKAIYVYDKTFTTFELNHHTRPWDALVKTNSTRDFTSYIDPMFNTKINQATYFSFSDLPTSNVSEGTELIIYANGNWNPEIVTGIYYNGFKYGCLHLKFHNGKWLIIGDSNISGE